MTTAILNPALASVATQVPLLSSPWGPGEIPAMEIAEAFCRAGISDDGAISDSIPIVEELRFMSPEWNACYYDEILRGHVIGFTDADVVRRRLEAELGFYRELYSRKPGDRYLIHPVDELVMENCLIDPSAIVFASGRVIYGCADFVSLPDSLIIDYVLGYSRTDPAEQKEIFGSPWYEVFMERVIAAYAHLRDIGVELLLSIKWEHLRLPRWVRDRYFIRRPVGPQAHHPLNYNRARVKRAMGAA